ncbi:MAG: hypothetical protein AAF331_10510 [Pseudomonadota bacterium]
MIRMTTTPAFSETPIPAAAILARNEVNALDIDAFVTPEQTPKKESRRGWRRRRIRRGKS